MAGKKKYNENYIHACDGNKIKIHDHVHSIYEMGYTDEEVKDILNFYLFCPPTLSNSNKKETDIFGAVSLKHYGWYGNVGLRKLEGQLLKNASIGVFIFIKSSEIENTLDSMDLLDNICIEHPRCVLKQNCSVSMEEDGSIKIADQEKRMECLFRHIRNALAHNRMYYFQNGNILLEDAEEKSGAITARILLPKEALLKWINIVKNNSQIKKEQKGSSEEIGTKPNGGQNT